MPERDVVSWSTMIGCYGKNGIQFIGLRPGEVALINMISLCADLAVLQTARAMHCYAVKNISSEAASTNVNTALIDIYMKSYSLIPVQRIIDRTTNKNVVTWTAMIAGYVRACHPGKASVLFGEMVEADIVPNEITMISLLVECGVTGSLPFGKWLHAHVLKKDYEMAAPLSTALLDMNGKCNEVKLARAIFDSFAEKDATSWTAMISAYARVKNLEEAFHLFTIMRRYKCVPNQVTMACLLSLCAEVGALELGKLVHRSIDKMGINIDLVLATSLVDYAKCGDVETACLLFQSTENRDICMWNAMLCGFAMHGPGVDALEIFSEMERSPIKPNGITFVGLLYACNHTGMVEEGRRIFSQITNKYKMIPMACWKRHIK